MKVCPKCFTEAPEDTHFCPNCGESMPADESEESGDMTGRVIAGKFKILSPVGEGAMGSIWKAEQTSLNKMVCIKVLHPHLSGDKTVSKRFHREARAASRIKHSNAINIIDFGMAEDGTHYIAMDFIDGTDLAHIIRDEHPLAVARAFKMVEQVCTALDEAHAQGVIHRDLKPENIMVENRRHQKDFVTVLDFGIAKITDPGNENPETFHTIAGMVCGTPEYMSPEQARGESLDARSDIYSLGIIMYHMFTGKLPFTADTPIGVVTKHLTQEPVKPRVIQDQVHPAVEHLIMQLMAKDREQRPQSCMDIVDRMKEVLKVIESGEKYDQTAPMSRPSQAELQSAVDDELTAGEASFEQTGDSDLLPSHGKGIGTKATVAALAVIILAGAGYFAFTKFFGTGEDTTTSTPEQVASEVAADRAEVPEQSVEETAAPETESDGSQQAGKNQSGQAGMTPEQMLKLAGQMTAYTRTLSEYQLAYAQNDRMLKVRLEQWQKEGHKEKIETIENLLEECHKGKHRIAEIQNKVEAGNLDDVDTEIEVEKERVALIKEKAETILSEELPEDSGQAGDRLTELTSQIGTSRGELAASLEKLENKKTAWAETPQTKPLEAIDELQSEIKKLDQDLASLVNNLDKENVSKQAVQYGMRLGKQDVLKQKVQVELNREVGATRAELKAQAEEDKKKAEKRRQEREERAASDAEKQRQAEERAQQLAEEEKKKAEARARQEKKEARTRAKEFEKMGDQARSQGSYAKAKAYYKQSLKLRSTATLHKKLGKTYNSMSNYSKGSYHLRKYITLMGSSLSPTQRKLIESQIRE